MTTPYFFVQAKQPYLKNTTIKQMKQNNDYGLNKNRMELNILQYHQIKSELME